MFLHWTQTSPSSMDEPRVPENQVSRLSLNQHLPANYSVPSYKILILLSGRFCTFVKLLSQENSTMLILFNNNQGVTAASEKCFPWTGQKSPVSVRWGWFFLQERFFGSNLGQTMICHSKVMIWIKPSARRARIRLTCMMPPWRVRMIKNDLLDV